MYNMTNQSNSSSCGECSNTGCTIIYYSLPVIIVVGTVCNVLTFLVMSCKKRMSQQSIYFYMGVLAVADELCLLIGCLNTWLKQFICWWIYEASVVSDRCQVLIYSCDLCCCVVIRSLARFLAP